MSFEKEKYKANLNKSTCKFLIFTVIITAAYSYLLGCGKKEPDLKRDLVEHKIISLGENTELSESGENPFKNDTNAMENGKRHYQTLCQVCHGEGGRGNTGPDLLDDVWLHGSDNFATYSLIMNGVRLEHMKMNPPRGKMPGYKNILGPQKVLEIMAWLDSEKAKIKPDIED